MKYYTNKKCLPYSVGFEFGFKLVFIKVFGQCFLAHDNSRTLPFTPDYKGQKIETQKTKTYYTSF